MTLILLQAMIQSISSTLYWIGFYVGIRALPGDEWRRRRWAIGSAVILVAWLSAAMLIAANGFFRPDAPRIPLALLTTLAAGYLLLLSPTFRAVIAVLGSMAVQGSVITWVADHRKHHAFSDQQGDPHSPHLSGPGFWGAVSGLWHAHVGWLFESVGTAVVATPSWPELQAMGVTGRVLFASPTLTVLRREP